MFRLIAISLLSLLLSVSALKAQKIQTELIIGLNASQIDGDGIVGYNKAGLYLGGSAGIPLKDEDLLLRFRIAYSQKGSRTSQNDLDNGLAIFTDNRFNYIDFPLLFEYHIKDRFLVEVGPSVSRLISSKSDIGGFGFSRITDQSTNYIYSFHLGGGYIYHEFIFRIAFHRSLNLMTDFGYLDRTLNFSVAYSFR